MSFSKGAVDEHTVQASEAKRTETQFEDLPDILIQKILEILHRNQIDPEQMAGWLAFKMMNKRLASIAKRCDGCGWLGPPIP